MSLDTNITDQCLFFTDTDAANLPYYLNPDVIMINTTDNGLAVVGTNNTQVTVRCKSSSDSGPTCPTTDQQGNPTRAVFELFLSPAALSLSLSASSKLPDSTHSPIQVAGTGVVTPGAVNGTPTTVTWTSQDTDPTQPNFVDPTNTWANHKCLVARCYTIPDGQRDEADSALLDHLSEDLTAKPPQPRDPHYAQHNLNIQPVTGPGSHRINIQTVNPFRVPQLMVIQAIPDLNPNPAVMAAILPGVKTVPGFTRFANASDPLPKVSLNLHGLTANGGSILEKIEDFLIEEVRELLRFLEQAFGKATPHGGGAHGRVTIAAGVHGTFELILDLSAAQPGTAYAYDVTQVTPQGLPSGGMKLVLVRV